MHSYVNQFPPLCHQENSQFQQERNTLEQSLFETLLLCVYAQLDKM